MNYLMAHSIFSHPFLVCIWWWLIIDGWRSFLPTFRTLKISSTSHWFQYEKVFFYMWPSWYFIPQKILVCFNVSGFPKSSGSKLLFTTAVCLNLLITSCIRCCIIPATLTLSLAMQLDLANGILAMWCKQRLRKGLCIRAYSLLLLSGTLILAEQEAWPSLLEDEHAEQI